MKNNVELSKQIKLSCRNVWKVYGDNSDGFFSNNSYAQEDPSILSKKITEQGHIVANANVSFDVHIGEIFVIMGLSGSGKSTIVRCLSRLIEPTVGEILLDEENLLGKSEKELIEIRRHKMGMVFQNFGLLPHLNVIENIAFPLKLQGLKEKERLQKAARVIELVGLNGRENNFPMELSGGQQQRTALARALVKDSDLILLDEPLANLDFKLREELREELPKLFEDRDCIVVYATTEPSDALMIGGNTATLLEGKVIQYGKTLEVYNRPENLISAKVFSDPPMNIAEITKSGDNCKFTDNDVQWKSSAKIKDGTYKIGIRPHNITTYKEGNNSVEINGKVQISELSGSESLIHFTNGSLNWVSLSNGTQQKNVGEDTKLYMNTDEFLYFDQNNRLVNNG